MRPYFANEAPYSPACAARLMAVVDRWYDRLPFLRSYQRARLIRQGYYGLPSDASPFDVATIGEMGRQGELSAINLNQMGVLGQRILSMTITDELGWQPVVQNQDAQSRKEAAVARSVLEYERRAGQLDRTFALAAETAFLDASAFMSIRWDERGGDVYEKGLVDSATGKEQPTIYEGSLKVRVHAWWRTMFDLYRHDADHEWVILVDYVNRYDLAARYAKGDDALTQRILNLEREHRKVLVSQQERGWVVSDDDTNNVPVYTLFHRACETLPHGREVVFINGATVLKDGANIYGKGLPVVRIAPGEWLDTPHGSTPLVNLTAPQAAFNMAVSSDLTNVANGAVSRLWLPPGMKPTRTVMEDGAEIYQSDTKPEALNTVGSSPKTAELAAFMSGQMAELAHMNPVSLGRQERQMSGALAALFDAKSREGISPFIRSYRWGVESAGTQILRTYRACAKVPRALEVIVGKDRSYMLKDFTGQALGSVDRVTVEARASMLDTTSGKMAFLDALMQLPSFAQNPRAAEIVLAIHTTGSIDPLILAPETEDILIQQENEWMRDGQLPPVRAEDDDAKHIEKHRLLSLNPGDRLDDATMVTLDEHLAMHRQSMLMKSGAMGPPGMPPPGGTAPPEGAPPTAPMDAPPQGLAPVDAGPDGPNMPQMPINPETNERAPAPA